MKDLAYTQEEIEMAKLMKVLGHPARVAILEHLLKVKECICGHIVDVLPLAQPTVSQHLKELKNAGLIKGSIEGNTICYCIDPGGIDRITTYFATIKEKIEEMKMCC